MSRLRGHRDSFKFAFEGLFTAFKQEPNFQVHVVMAILVMISAALLRFSTTEWLLLLYVISFVIVLELVNTSLEAIVNMVSPEKQEKAKVAKDVAASGVLVAAIVSIVIAITLFLPKIVHLLKITEI